MSEWTKRASTVAVLLALLAACDKGKGDGEKSPATTDSTKATSSASTTASASASASASSAVAKSVEVTGSYTSAVGEIRTPKDAPAFKGDTTAALGAGTITIVLPAENGPVLGKATGALGNQRFSGTLDDTTLTGSLAPIDLTPPAFWGTLTATISGSGAQRTAKGTLRVSDKEGRVVRESAFELKAAK
jgi:hypothetical protein